MITLVLFVAGVAALVPLLQRDLTRAVERRRLRAVSNRIVISFDLVDNFSTAMRRAGIAAGVSTAMRRAGIAAGAAGLAAAGAVPSFKSILEAVRKAEQADGRLAAMMRIRPEEIRYKLRIEHERSLARAYVGVLLDDWCREYGWDPVNVWRNPRAQEHTFPLIVRQVSDAEDSMRMALASYRHYAAVSRTADVLKINGIGGGA